MTTQERNMSWAISNFRCECGMYSPSAKKLAAHREKFCTLNWNDPAKYNLNEVQSDKFLRAIGDGTDWPKATNDPRVVWAVDCYSQEEMLEYDEDLYQREQEALEAVKIQWDNGVSP